MAILGGGILVVLGSCWAGELARAASPGSSRGNSAVPVSAQEGPGGKLADAAQRTAPVPAASQTNKAPPPGAIPATDSAGPKGRLRLREGAWLVDQLGHFRTVGDRWVFVIEPAGTALVALENRNLERIARAVASYPRRLRWRVTASVTEFQGNFFILIEMAVVKSEEGEVAETDAAHPVRGDNGEKTRAEESPPAAGEGKL